MKTSIKRRIAFTFIGLMIAALLAIGIINIVFSDGFYRREKQRKLQKSWEMFNAEVLFEDSYTYEEDETEDSTDDTGWRDKRKQTIYNDEIEAEEVEEDSDPDDGAVAISEELEHFCQVNALTYAVIDYNLNFRLTNAQDGDSMASRLFGNLFEVDGDNTTVLSQTDYYNIIMCIL